MANFNSVLNERISRVARKQIKAETTRTKRLTAQHRRDLAALKRQVQDLSRRLAFIEQQSKKQLARSQAPVELAEGARFSARSVAAQRRRLGLSAEKFGRLAGVSGLTIYHWESGKSRPRKQQLAKLVAVRQLGKREALKRLELLNGR